MEFNPYSEWLAIPPSQTPPTHYRLLGLKDHESRAERIDQAARMQTSRLVGMDSPEHEEVRRRILEEIEQARQVLRDADERTHYDRQLRRGMTLPSADIAPMGQPKPTAEPLTEEVTDTDTAWTDDPVNVPESDRWPREWTIILTASLVTLLLLALVALGLLVASLASATANMS